MYFSIWCLIYIITQVFDIEIYFWLIFENLKVCLQCLHTHICTYVHYYKITIVHVLLEEYFQMSDLNNVLDFI